ncbi:MAG TPA: long-chain fatty acid--CoA ligase [Sandaracinaceae bacterium LLY-WYZ-13_1]|nr:long-chain fatty acid--CoA ligase [Sandaracinaceae bacterium LLY-WYZ-13_1]
MAETLLTLFDEQVERSPRRTALRYRSGGLWRGRTWSEWRDTTRCLAAALCAWGIEPGDRIAILSHTRIRWVEADLGILHAGAATVPIYPTLRADTVADILRDAGVRLLFAEDPVQLAKVFDEAAGALEGLERAVVFEPVSRLQRPDAQGRLDVRVDDVRPEGAAVAVHTFDEALERGRARRQETPDELARRAAEVTPETLAAVYYTSGTSGEPKGVELTHDNFTFESAALAEVMPVGPSDEQLLFLPLAHIVAKLTVMLQLRVGYVTSFAASIEQAADDSAEVRPTFIVGVPRVFEKIQEAIERRPSEHGDIQRRVFDWAMGVGRRVSELAQRGRAPGALLSVQRRSAERLVFDRVERRLGGRIRFMLSGAAPLSKSTAEFFHALGLLILEGYGLTETTGATAVNTPDHFRFGTVGRPLPGVEIELAEDGEILVRGRHVTPGYHGRGPGPREAFTEDGWLRTGDVGRFDADGYLEITDRKKDLIITAGGKNVAPQRVEQRLGRIPYVDRAVVLGDRRKFPVALIVPDPEAVRAWAEENGLGGDLGALLRHPRVRDLIAREVERVNETLASFEAVKRFEIVVGDLGPVLTPTGKIKRRLVAEHFADVVDQLYEGVTTELDELT